jgi:hypothetical protein
MSDELVLTGTCIEPAYDGLIVFVFAIPRSAGLFEIGSSSTQHVNSKSFACCLGVLLDVDVEFIKYGHVSIIIFLT